MSPKATVETKHLSRIIFFSFMGPALLIQVCLCEDEIYETGQGCQPWYLMTHLISKGKDPSVVDY